MSYSAVQLNDAARLGAATLHEAAGRIGALPSAIKPVAPDMRIVGPAFTVHIPAGDNLWIHRAIYQAAPGDVLVISTSGGIEWGYWGDILNTAAIAQRLGGLVIDGGVRDVAGLATMPFPVFSNGICLNGTIKGFAATAWTRQPIRIGNVVVAQGDLVVGDRDGVVVLPPSSVENALLGGARRETDEAEKIVRIQAGERTIDIYGFGESGASRQPSAQISEGFSMNIERQYPIPSLFIAGVWRGASDGGTIPIVNPATGETIGDLPVATHGDLDEALAAADAGFKIWRAVSAYDRSKTLRAAGQLLRERAPQLGAISTIEQGKPIGESTAEAFACADIFDWYAEEGRRAYGRIIPSKHPGVRHMVTKEPIGPVAAFSPWNFPTTIPARKIAAALAAGCSVVIKPAEETPGSALALARALDDAGLPKGVLNVVFGVPADISTHLIASPVIRKVTFTGSTAVGKQLGVLAAKVMKPTTMELGGHAPVIVFGDADLDRAVRTLVVGKYRNAGQICIAPTRFYVHDSIHDAFVEKFAAAAAQLQIGNGLDRATGMGPLANPRRLSAMQDMIADAAAAGARVATGGERHGGAGNFWLPTVLSDVPDAARIMSEEPFGPVAVTQRFTDYAEVVAQANRLPYGLAAYAWTQSARTAADIGDDLEAGMIGINFVGLTGPETPFGGVKESGHGSEGGIEGLEAYLHHKYIAQG